MLQPEIDAQHIDLAETIFRGRIVSYQKPGRFGSMLKFSIAKIYKGKIRRNARVIWHYGMVDVPSDLDEFRDTYGDEHIVGLGPGYKFFWDHAPPVDRMYHLYEKHVRGAQWIMPTPCAPPFIIKVEPGNSETASIEVKLRELGMMD